MEHAKGMYAGIRRAGLRFLGLDDNGKPKKKPQDKDMHRLNSECPYLGNSSPNQRTTRSSGGP